MRYEALTPEAYIAQLPQPRRNAVAALRKTVRDHLPEGFEETMQYGMITYVVPHALYPAGYRANPSDPLPFISIGSQKQYLSLYHMGLYAFPEHLAWFQNAYAATGIGRLDMGKSCIRFKNEDKIPFDLIGQLCGRISVQDYIGKVSHA